MFLYRVCVVSSPPPPRMQRAVRRALTSQQTPCAFAHLDLNWSRRSSLLQAALSTRDRYKSSLISAVTTSCESLVHRCRLAQTDSSVVASMVQDPAPVVAQNLADLNAIYNVERERQEDARQCVQDLIASTTELEVVVSAEKEHWKAAAAKRDTAEQQLQQQEAEAKRQLQDLQATIENLQQELLRVHERRKHKQATLQHQLTLFSTISSIRFDNEASEGPPYKGTVLSHGTMRKFEVDPTAQGRLAAVNEVWRVVAGGRDTA